MGICLSSQNFRSAAKLILDDGGFKEFVEPVKVAEILRERTGFFVCHSDSMDFDTYLSPLSIGDELRPDHLYFLLPLTKLEYPLRASDMAALAVKAAAALQRTHYKNINNKRRRSKIIPVVEHDFEGRQIHKVGEFSHITLKSANFIRGSRRAEKRKGRVFNRRTTVSGGGGGEYQWKATLSTIPEAFAY